MTAALEVVTVSGRGERRRESPLLLVHGISHGAWCWQPHFAPYFADLGYDVHALSLRGHAGSPGRTHLHRNRLEDYVADVVAVATSLPGPPILIGHSMGGAIAQLTIRSHPRVARAVVLLTPMVPGGLRLRELARTAADPRRIPPLLRLLRGRRLSPAQANRLPFFDGRLDPDGARLAADRLQAESWRALVQLMTRFAPAGGPLPIPALVLGSARDSIFGAAPLRRTASHYALDAVVLDVGSHDLMLDPDWRASAELIATWMEGL
jgi:pimeloyl-ACP methyl ester carboxylesterase